MVTMAPTNPPGRPQPPPKPKRKKRLQQEMERARVLFSYTAENEDELTIVEGDVITILEKELEDSGWWRGEIGGRVGVFPDNFVDILPAEEVKPKKPPPPAVTKPAAPEAERSLQRPPPLAGEGKLKTEEKRMTPALPTKKPAMPPPPIGRKPPHGTKQTADLIAQTDDHKVKASQKEAGTAVVTPVARPGPARPSAGAGAVAGGRGSPAPADHAKPKPEVTAAPYDNATLGGSSPGSSSSAPLQLKVDLDSVPSGEPLSHPNASRVKAPQRRLPTIHNREQPEEGAERELDSDVPPPPPPPPPSSQPPPIPDFPESPRLRDVRRSQRRAQLAKTEMPKTSVSSAEDAHAPHHLAEEVVETRPRHASGGGGRPAPPLPKNEPPPSPTVSLQSAPAILDTPPTAAMAAYHQAATVELQESVSALRQELQALRKDTVPRSQYESLEREVAALREATTKLERLTVVLMNDIDESAKERRSMQVEIDRIRKLSLLPGTSTTPPPLS